MDLKKINELLSDLEKIQAEGKLISSDRSDNYYHEKNQGERGLAVEIYDIGEDGLFLKLVKNTDSYGDNESIVGVQFVTAQTKEVVVYE